MDPHQKQQAIDDVYKHQISVSEKDKQDAKLLMEALQKVLHKQNRK